MYILLFFLSYSILSFFQKKYFVQSNISIFCYSTTNFQPDVYCNLVSQNSFELPNYHIVEINYPFLIFVCTTLI